MIEEELDDALARQAAEEGVSKAALIRRYVGERLRPLPPLEDDPLWEFVGMSDAEPVDDIDGFLYGSVRRSHSTGTSPPPASSSFERPSAGGHEHGHGQAAGGYTSCAMPHDGVT